MHFLFSDLCTVFGSKIVPLMDVEAMNAILQRARRSRTTKTKSHATWAAKELRKLTKTSSW